MNYTKLFGMYGLLVMLVTQEIYFIGHSEQLDCNYEVTKDFLIQQKCFKKTLT